jgi:SAM-dependent methyltransferase
MKNDAKPLNWNNAASDYSTHRPGYPDNFFDLLQRLGVGRPGQQILDLGSGTGALAIPFARQGGRVTAVDLSAGQIAAAREKAALEGLGIRFIVSGAEDAPVEAERYHAVTASMCWGYFDTERVLDLVRRVLLPGGRLLISSIVWQEDDQITRCTNRLLAKYSERFNHRHEEPGSDPVPDWAKDGLPLQTFHRYRVGLPFTKESWRGRMRATKYIGAALPADQVEAFDRDLAQSLDVFAPEEFIVSHEIVIRIFQLSAGKSYE